MFTFYREIMQEWVETLRSKLREMKILSPRENLYTKLPEIRAPLLPTRDPTSPLPAPPPVPAAIVPGVERIVPPSLVQDNPTNEMRLERTNSTITATTSTIAQSVSTTTTVSGSGGRVHPPTTTTNVNNSGSNSLVSNVSNTTPQAMALPALTAMSNTLTQNLLNLLSDPISAYSEQINDALHMEENSFVHDANDTDFEDEFLSPILRKSQQRHENGMSTISTDNSVRVDIGQRASAGNKFYYTL